MDQRQGSSRNRPATRVCEELIESVCVSPAEISGEISSINMLNSQITSLPVSGTNWWAAWGSGCRASCKSSVSGWAIPECRTWRMR